MDFSAQYTKVFAFKLEPFALIYIFAQYSTIAWVTFQ